MSVTEDLGFGEILADWPVWGIAENFVASPSSQTNPRFKERNLKTSKTFPVLETSQTLLQEDTNICVCIKSYSL